ncbi:tetratricopeptide repeat protein [Pseudomarimonas salicorniae]|uniref:Tetratricopeptide repeat protein n=1 Tax=Pseudomarimonas salicorniae TaxID=2933270 RepID=A0ABT0GFS3_9GAMM|nr:toll/interleukin-1 receptor domain-containing protein [Lysobacter sp. CAU 1642]MCK7593389.1 tetratricopeptide repeat protein [Lysobacter sp. CAU 1642]
MATRYRAFLSYSHADEKPCARLHRRLERFRIPRALRGKNGATSLAPVFRDRDELGAAASLSTVIEEALDRSDALVVICSPRACRSPWVGEEIRHFRRRHPSRPVYAFVVAGDPGQDPRRHPDTAAIPLALLLADLERPEGPLVEPLAADARDEGDGFDAATLKLIAGLLGVGFDELRHREQTRRQRRLALLTAASLALTASFAFLAWQATVARDQAREAQALAELQLESERQTRGFLISVFQLADPGESKGSAVTVREILDGAVGRIDHTEFSRPAVKSSYLATLGRVYSSLGLNKRAEAMLGASLEALGDRLEEIDAWTQFVDVQIELATLRFDMGDYAAALEALDRLQQHAARQQRPLLAEQLARAANVRGDVLSFLERDDEAAKAYRSALEALSGLDGDSALLAGLRGHSRYGLAQLAMFAGDHAAAETGFTEAQSLFEATLGERHPRTIATLITRGSNAYQWGDRPRARALYMQALEAAETVFDDDSPQLGTLRNNLGRLQLELGQLSAAESLLQLALRSDRRHRKDDFDDLAYPLTNLAIIRLADGDLEGARPLLQEALEVTAAGTHPMRGAALNHLADLECMAGRSERGLVLAARAEQHAAEQYGEDNWRVAQAQLTAAYCGAASGAGVEPIQALSALQRLRTSSGGESPFLLRAEQQWVQISGSGAGGAGTGNAAPAH